jgi:hypothetical protein
MSAQFPRVRSRLCRKRGRLTKGEIKYDKAASGNEFTIAVSLSGSYQSAATIFLEYRPALLTRPRASDNEDLYAAAPNRGRILVGHSKFQMTFCLASSDSKSLVQILAPGINDR